MRLPSPLQLLRNAPLQTLAILASVALVALVHAVAIPALWALLGKPLPYQDAGELVQLRIDLRDIDFQVGLSPSLAQSLRSQSQTFSGVIGSQERGAPRLDAAGQPWELQRVTADFADVLGVRPSLGVGLVQAGDAQALLLSDSVWRERFGADPGVLGRELRIGTAVHRIAGVMPRGFGWPDRGAQAWTAYVATPVETDQDQAGGFGQFHVAARLAPGVSLAQAAAALQAALAASPSAFLSQPSDRVQPQVRAWRTQFTEDHVQPLWLLLGASLLLLLVAAANIGNLLLDRLWARRPQLLTRRALGARTRQLLALQAAELAWPAVLGMVLGWLAAPLLLDLLQQRGLLPDGLPVAIGGDGSTALAVLGSTLLVVLLALTVTAVVLPRLAPAGQVLERSDGRHLGRLQRLGSLVQIALATVLIGGAGLLLRSAWSLQSEPTGFAADGVLLTQVDLADAEQAGLAAAPAIRALSQSMAALPGVRSVALADMPPFGAAEFLTAVATGTREPEEVRSPSVGPGYFATLGTPLLAGREFRTGDADVAIVDSQFAERWGSPAAALGQTLTLDPGGDAPRPVTVVGVVASVRQQALDEQLRRPAVYSPAADGTSVQFLVSRTEGDAATLALAVRQLVARTLPDARLMINVPLAEAVARTLATRRTLLEGVAGFAITTLLLASLGLSALLGAAVKRRRRELGIRMALGESATQVRRRVLGGGFALLAIGTAAGVCIGMALARIWQATLFQVAPTDPAAWLPAALLVIALGLLTSWLPARRATRTPLREALAPAEY